MLAPDGRCKTLDAAGDGYVRAENCIVLLLESLLDGTLASAIVQGSAVKQVRHSYPSYLLLALSANSHAPTVQCNCMTAVLGHSSCSSPATLNAVLPQI